MVTEGPLVENGYGKPLTETDTETETDSRRIFTHEQWPHRLPTNLTTEASLYYEVPTTVW